MFSMSVVIFSIFLLCVSAAIINSASDDKYTLRGTACGVIVSAAVFYDKAGRDDEYFFSDLEKPDASPLRVYANSVGDAWLRFADCDNDHENAPIIGTLTEKWACFRFTNTKN